MDARGASVGNVFRSPDWQAGSLVKESVYFGNLKWTHAWCLGRTVGATLLAPHSFTWNCIYFHLCPSVTVILPTCVTCQTFGHHKIRLSWCRWVRFSAVWVEVRLPKRTNHLTLHFPPFYSVYNWRWEHMRCGCLVIYSQVTLRLSQ